MQRFGLSLALVAGLGLAVPAAAQSGFEDIIGGIAEGLIQQELDRSAYAAAQQANTIAAYRSYLKSYPKGAYRANAERAIAKLGGTVTDPAPEVITAAEVERGLNISRTQRIAVQRELTRLGYSTGGADGVWGRNTRNAIAGWQADRGEKATGYVTSAQLATLSKGSVIVEPPPPVTASAIEVEAALALTRKQRSDIQTQLTRLGYDTGVADGFWGTRTRGAIRAWQKANSKTQSGYVTAAQVRLIAEQAGRVADPVPPVGSSAEAEERLLGLTLAEKAEVQRRLVRLGYSVASTDGQFGASSRRAIAEWQGDSGEAITGFLTADQVRALLGG